MTEYQLLDLMYQGFIQNAMYFVGMVLLTWLGFRMASNVASDPNMPGQIFTTIFCLFVGLFWFTTNQIGGGVLSSYTAQLIEMGADSGTRLSEIANSPAAPGGALQVAFNIFIVIFQLAIIWVKR